MARLGEHSTKDLEDSGSIPSHGMLLVDYQWRVPAKTSASVSELIG